ncbi:MAG: tetratricopeptide repeat protein [Chitinispirillaceae bacterium]|nr:tetratricopeptide repeat protein [Chitinispirillaceae bacterium]
MPKKNNNGLSIAVSRRASGDGPGIAAFQGEKEVRRANLQDLCALVISGRQAYSDVAENIENRAYEEWKRGSFEKAVEALKHLAAFLEKLEDKSEESAMDLAEIYQLIGQIYQYAEWYPESIEWLSKAVFVNDRDPLPYHFMARSYIKTGNFHYAIRCFEQELALDEGNYFTYLQLAELYGREGKPGKAEECLKQLLNRDPENIQALHRLIRHYERHSPSIDPGLLRKRLLGLVKKHNWTSAVIRSYHLAAEKKTAEALAFLSAWQLDNSAHPSPVVHLVKAQMYDSLGSERDMAGELAAFVTACHSRQEVMRGYIEEYVALFGEEHAVRLKERLRKTGPARARRSG